MASTNALFSFSNSVVALVKKAFIFSLNTRALGGLDSITASYFVLQAKNKVNEFKKRKEINLKRNKFIRSKNNVYLSVDRPAFEVPS